LVVFLASATCITAAIVAAFLVFAVRGAALVIEADGVGGTTDVAAGLAIRDAVTFAFNTLFVVPAGAAGPTAPILTACLAFALWDAAGVDWCLIGNRDIRRTCIVVSRATSTATAYCDKKQDSHCHGRRNTKNTHEQPLLV